MTVDARLMTADELLRIPDDGYRYELVRGELKKMSPGKRKHGRAAGRIHGRLAAWVFDRNLGDVYSSDTGFLLARNPDTVRCPDVSFVRREHLLDEDDFPAAPDLAIEVKSPSNTDAELLAKTAEYLEAGTQAVIIVDPRRKTVVVHRPSGATVISDVLTVDEVIPGWQLPLSDIFS
jgi:Uma2 family endonuclease